MPVRHLVRFALLAASLLSGGAWAGAPALVTLARGEVTLADGAVPATPFLLPDGASLVLGRGATVVVLHQGVATRKVGPGHLDVSMLATPTPDHEGPGAGALGELLARNATVGRAGASRASIELLRPLERDVVLDLHDVAWRCDAGCDQSVPIELYSVYDDAVVWKGAGAHRVAYAGPALSPGAYIVSIDGHKFSFRVASAADRDLARLATEEAQRAASALEASGASRAEAASLVIGTYLTAGFAADALHVLDQAVRAHPADAELGALLLDTERRLGLPR